MRRDPSAEDWRVGRPISTRNSLANQSENYVKNLPVRPKVDLPEKEKDSPELIGTSIRVERDG